MTNKTGQTRQRTNNLRNELIWQKVGVSLRRQNGIAVKDIFNETGKCCNHRYRVSVYFYTPLLITYLSAIGTLICRREMSLIGSTSFGFAQNTMHDFQNTVLKTQSGIVFDKCNKKLILDNMTFRWTCPEYIHGWQQYYCIALTHRYPAL